MNFVDELRTLVKGWNIADVCAASSPDGLCEFILENFNGKTRCLTICCTDFADYIENIIDDGYIYVSLDDMLDNITRHIENNAEDMDELVALYGDNVWLPLVKFGSIIVLEDVKKLQLGFQFEKDGKTWWTTTAAIKKSNHPFKHFFTDRDGRRKLADLLCRSVLDPERAQAMTTQGVKSE